MSIRDDIIRLLSRLAKRPIDERDIVAAYRRLRPGSRVQRLLKHTLSTWGARRRECILCGWKSGVYPTSFPLSPDYSDEERAHVQAELDGINRRLALSSDESTE